MTQITHSRRNGREADKTAPPSLLEICVNLSSAATSDFCRKLIVIPPPTRHDGDALIALHAYQLLEDAWTGGVADWCRSASAGVLGGGRAWIVTTGEGQGNWVRSRLLCEGVSLFGVQFLDARSLRRELCLRLGVTPPVLGRETLELLLRLYALRDPDADPELSSVARHPGACLAALGDLANAGWLDGPGRVARRRVGTRADAGCPNCAATAHGPRKWIASCWRGQGDPIQGNPRFPSACSGGRRASGRRSICCWRRCARRTARRFLPRCRAARRRRSSSHWLEALEQGAGGEFEFCESSGFPSSQADLVSRLEGSGHGQHGGPAEGVAEPELLVGVDTAATWSRSCGILRCAGSPRVRFPPRRKPRGCVGRGW